MNEGYSAQNLRRIWDTQTRRGQTLSDLYTELADDLWTLRELRGQRREAKRLYSIDPGNEERKLSLETATGAVRSSKEAFDNALLRKLYGTAVEIRDGLTAQSFVWPMKFGPNKRKRQTYELNRTAVSFFAAKQLESELAAKAMTVSMSRDAIVGQVVQSLDDPLPKIITRIDIDSFFESIPHDRILTMLSQRAVGRESLFLVERFLEGYRFLASTTKGLPRGIGISSRLAELYLEQLDVDLKSAPGVIFAARYVDDIVVVEGAATGAKSSDTLSSIRDRLMLLGLTINGQKSQSIAATSAGGFGRWEYLGYQLHKAGSLTVRLVPARVDVLRNRVALSFGAWSKKDPANTGHRGLLLNRVRVLTGNTRLYNNKRNALVGSYFSHRHLTDLSQLRGLDSELSAIITSYSLPGRLEDQLRKLSFERGFLDRRMHRFTPRELRDMTRLWRDA